MGITGNAPDSIPASGSSASAASGRVSSSGGAAGVLSDDHAALGGTVANQPGSDRSVVPSMHAGSSASAGKSAAVGSAGSAGSPATAEILEVNVTNMPELENGMPGIAINPKDSSNLVYVSTQHNLMGPEGLLAQDAWGCFVAYSTDGGKNWLRTTLPYGDATGCSVPSLRVDPDGNFYILFNMLGSTSEDPLAALTAPLETNNAALARSTDGGRTWSAPVKTPLRIGGEPKLRIDAKTQKIYAVAGLEFLFPSGVAVSSDQGLTWSKPRFMPTHTACVDGYPLPGMKLCGFPGNQIAVHDGILVTAVNREKDNAVTFHVSRDDGESWRNFTLTDGKGKPVVPAAGPLMPSDPGGGVDPMPWLSADPTKSGRFAAMLCRDKKTLEVYVTEDAGENWNGPTVIEAPGAERSWFEFGPSGSLGVMWRTPAVDAYSVVSFDAGRTFGIPLKINQVTQPLSDSYAPGDDWSSIALDNEYAYIAWSDGRTGGAIDGIFARVPLSRYRSP